MASDYSEQIADEDKVINCYLYFQTEHFHADILNIFILRVEKIVFPTCNTLMGGVTPRILCGKITLQLIVPFYIVMEIRVFATQSH